MMIMPPAVTVLFFLQAALLASLARRPTASPATRTQESCVRGSCPCRCYRLVHFSAPSPPSMATLLGQQVPPHWQLARSPLPAKVAFSPHTIKREMMEIMGEVTTVRADCLLHRHRPQTQLSKRTRTSPLRLYALCNRRRPLPLPVLRLTPGALQWLQHAAGMLQR